MNNPSAIVHLLLVFAVVFAGLPGSMADGENIWRAGDAGVEIGHADCPQSEAKTHPPRSSLGTVMECMDHGCDHACVHHSGATVTSPSLPAILFAFYPVNTAYSSRLPAPDPAPPYRPPIA
jgi:hypothetical protein